MAKKIRTFSILLLAGAVGACSGPAAGDADAENVVAPSATADNLAVTDAVDEGGNAANAVVSAAPPSPTPTANATPVAETVKSLPLKRGFYVTADTPCGQSSNATTLLVRRDGINGSREQCTFKKIEKIGATTYRVTSECLEIGGWGREQAAATYTNVYDIPNDTSFKVSYDGGSSSQSRYCAQSSMSPDFRSNDISDAIR